MKPAPFDYVRPSSITEALQALSALDDVKILAGGQSLMPMLNMRFVQPAHVIDVNRIDLSYIRLDGEKICIGAATRQRDLELSPVVKTHAPILVEALQHVGHVQTRNRGTIGGSLCHLDPSAEIPAICMTMDAEILVQSFARGTRTIAMRDFPAGYMAPAIELDELVIEVRLPIWPRSHGFAFEEFSRRHGDFAIASATVMVLARAGVIERAAITVAGLETAPTRIGEAEKLLIGRDYRQVNLKEVADLCGRLEASADTQASAEYRKHLATVMASRALARAIDRAVRTS